MGLLGRHVELKRPRKSLKYEFNYLPRTLAATTGYKPGRRVYRSRHIFCIVDVWSHVVAVSATSIWYLLTVSRVHLPWFPLPHHHMFAIT